MTRSNARELAAHLIYEISYTGQEPEQALRDRFDADYYQTLAGEADAYAEQPEKKQLAYIEQVVAGVTRCREQLNQTIAKYAVGWNIDRISRLAKTFMQIAIYECLYVSDVPAGAAINEAVVLTKKYDEPAAKFVNGILGSFAATLAEKEDAQP